MWISSLSIVIYICIRLIYIYIYIYIYMYWNSIVVVGNIENVFINTQKTKIKKLWMLSIFRLSLFCLRKTNNDKESTCIFIYRSICIHICIYIYKYIYMYFFNCRACQCQNMAWVLRARKWTKTDARLPSRACFLFLCECVCVHVCVCACVCVRGNCIMHLN